MRRRTQPPAIALLLSIATGCAAKMSESSQLFTFTKEAMMKKLSLVAMLAAFLINAGFAHASEDNGKKDADRGTDKRVSTQLMLPEPKDVKTISIKFDHPKLDDVQFTATPADWKAIRAALLPAKPDQNPASWEWFGTVRIITKDNQPFRIGLYTTSKDPGAFAAGETFGQRVYYRGGKKAELVKAVMAAYELAAAPTEDHNASPKPNILIIMTDHWFSDAMSCVIGNEYINTPAIDSLAANGMLFSRAYTTPSSTRTSGFCSRMGTTTCTSIPTPDSDGSRRTAGPSSTTATRPTPPSRPSTRNDPHYARYLFGREGTADSTEKQQTGYFDPFGEPRFFHIRSCPAMHVEARFLRIFAVSAVGWCLTLTIPCSGQDEEPATVADISSPQRSSSIGPCVEKAAGHLDTAANAADCRPPIRGPGGKPLGPTLAPKPYRIGIAPSHITKPTAPLFGERINEWDEVRRQIDFYKVYSLQAVPPDWATPLPVDAFAQFAKEHHIAVDAEFGNFRPGVGAGKAAAERARAMHTWMKHRGVQMRALHLDGPIRRMMGCDRETVDGLDLKQAAEELAEFLVECRKTFPKTRIGLITNFPNWHYTPEQPGMLGTWSNQSGVHYRDALEAVYLAAKRKGTCFDFVEVDCPWNYYRAKANRTDPTRRVDNAVKFKALQRWCEQQGVEFWLVVNYDTNPQKVAGKPELGNRLFHDETLAYIRRLRRDGIFPDCLTIQSWYKLPVEHLPEDGGYSFMHTARDSIRLIRELFPRPSASDKRNTAETSPVKVILDTDMSGDCDDAGTLALLHALAVNHSSNPKVPG